MFADASSEHTSDGDTGPAEEGTKLLVIPEKASSFSIHPDRLCKDECTYCFGKFGLFDTPCHIATLKSVERQDRILAGNINNNEKFQCIQNLIMHNQNTIKELIHWCQN